MNSKNWMETLIHFSRGLTGLVCLLAIAGLTSCEENLNEERSESITVYSDPAGEPLTDYAFVSVLGGTAKFYVDANIDFTVSWEDGESSPWASVLSYDETDPGTGYKVVTLNVKRRSSTACYYTRRSGSLILSAADGSLNYNRIISVHQGATARVSSDFSFLRYGTADPRVEDGETSISNWSSAQLDYGFTSTVGQGQSVAHCYGKNGYLKLGDADGHGADLISPYTNTLRSDSLLMVSFRAVAYTDFYTNVKDDNKIKFEVLEGGVIADYAEQGVTSLDLETAYFDMTDEDFPTSMWQGTDFMIFIAGTPTNEVNANTRVRISCGSLSEPSSGNHRIFIDNFYIRRLTQEEKDYYFTENGGSGKDNVLGRSTGE